MAQQLSTIEIKRGETYNIVLTFTEDADPTPLPIDLSIYDNIKADFREGPAEYSTLVFSKELGDGITISGDDDNILTISISSADTELMQEGNYYFDIRFTAGAAVSIEVEGIFNVTQNITAA
jgi:hypothetical protein